MRKAILLTFILLSVFSRAICQDIYTYTYTIPGTVGTPTYSDPSLATASAMTPIGTSTITACTGGFSGICGFTGFAYTSAGPCINITLTALPGLTIDATRFYAYLRRSGTGPVAVRLAYSTDAVTWIDDGIDHAPTNGGCATSFAMTTLADWTFTVTNPTLYFRLYPFGASGATGTLQIYDLHIEGNVHPMCAKPVVTVTPVADSFCSGGAGVSLTGSGAGTGGTYTWLPSAGLSATTGAAVTAAPGTTTVYSLVGTTSLGCKDTVPVTVKVLPLPPAFITPSGATTFCMNDSVELAANAGTGYLYQWYNGPTLIPGATNISYFAKTAGNYMVDIVNGFGCNATSAPETIVTKPLPSATITPSGPTVFCAGDHVELDVAAGIGYTFQWYKLGTLIPGATSSSYTSDTTNSYTVVVTDPGGCKGVSADMRTLLVPSPKILQSDTTFCGGNSVALSMNVSGIAGLSYQWQNTGVNIPGATSDVYIGNSSGIYTCIVLVNGSCTFSSDPISMNVLPVKIPAITYNGTFSTAKGYVSYQWFLNNIGVAGATSNTWKPKMNGSYRVRVTDLNGCITYSSAINVYTVGIADLNTAGNISIYPNPASSLVHIESPERVKAVLTEAAGRKIFEQADARDMDISSLANGIYIIMLYDDNDQRLLVQKLIKQ